MWSQYIMQLRQTLLRQVCSFQHLDLVEDLCRWEEAGLAKAYLIEWKCAGLDFEHTEGNLTFESGESHKVFTVPLIGTPNEGTFTVYLTPVSSGIVVRCPYAW